MLEREKWAVLGVNLYGLDKFNEIYGFVARDDVLRAVALTITSLVDELGSVDDFIGHPNENQILILTIPTKAAPLKQQIEDRLNQAMVYFYPIHDREAGFVQLGGEDGPVEKVPFLYIYVNVVASGDQAVIDVDKVKTLLNQRVKV